jgi:hypothetical protein
MVSEAAKNALGLFIALLLLLYLWKPQPFFLDGFARPGWGSDQSSVFNIGNLTIVLAVLCFFVCVLFE